jgi:hypothetical protein
MLKVLLYAYVSLLAHACYSQDTLAEWSSPGELVVEDPSRTVSDISASNLDRGKLQLTWKLAGDAPQFFSIERSNDGKNFETVGVINKLGVQKTFQWIDEAPKNGRSFYRLRYSFREGESLYSKTLSASITAPPTYKFYPNPVDHVLIVRSDTPIDVQISDATGKIRITQPRVQGIHTINVSSLEKGIYLIRFSNKLTSVMFQEKLIKN